MITVSFAPWDDLVNPNVDKQASGSTLLSVSKSSFCRVFAIALLFPFERCLPANASRQKSLSTSFVAKRVAEGPTTGAQ